MNRTRRMMAGTIALVAVGSLLLVQWAASAGAGDDPADSVIDDSRVGEAVAGSSTRRTAISDLQLEGVDSKAEIDACEGGIVELTDGDAYCIPLSLAPNDLDQWVVGARVRGRVPTTAEIDLFLAMTAYTDAIDRGASEEELQKLRSDVEVAAEAAPDE